MFVLWFCGRSKTYRGVVVDATSGDPIGGAKVSGCYFYRDRFAPSWDGLFDIDNAWVTVWTEKDGRFEIRLEGFNHLIRVTRVGYTAKKVRLWELPYREELIVEMVRESWFGEGLK